MGIQDLSPRLRQPSERPDSLDDPRLRGQRVGVDVSKYLHRATSSKIGAEQATASPRVPVTQVEVVLSALLAACRKQVGETGISRGITPVFVFDGVRPSVKSLEDRRRAKEQVGAEAQLGSLRQGQRVRPQRGDEAAQAPRQGDRGRRGNCALVSPRSSCEVLGAPFEVDWQLAHLERSGYTVATITEDSDLFPLGSKLMVTLLRESDGSCAIVIASCYM